MDYLAHDAITHAAVWYRDSRDLNRRVPARSVVRYLRFRREVDIDELELGLSAQVGRWTPFVPSHPAHITVSVPDSHTLEWEPVRDFQLPADPRIWGEGIRDEDPMEAIEAHFARILGDTMHRLRLGGVVARCLRVECDREHPVWHNHGECNGGEWNVPWRVLHPLRAVGTERSQQSCVAAHVPPLTVTDYRPRPPARVQVERRSEMVVFRSARFEVGFSLRRPVLTRLGWDVFRSADDHSALTNLLCVRRSIVGSVGGLSGPVIRGLDVDRGAHLWTGSVTVVGDRVVYTVSPAPILPERTGTEVTLTAAFTVLPDGVDLEIVQDVPTATPVLEAEAWRFVWDLSVRMTGTASVPDSAAGRNGRLQPPIAFTSDGLGSLVLRAQTSEQQSGFVQTESYRSSGVRTDGIVMTAATPPGACMLLQPGIRRACYSFRLAAFEPDVRSGNAERDVQPDVVRRYWGSIYSCFRPELYGFSNHAVSTNCHVNQWAPVEIASYTSRSESAPDPLALARYTIESAVMGGGGYGYHRDLYLDSDPVLVSMAGRIFQACGDAAWVARIQPGLEAALRRMLRNLDENGLLVSRALTGNSGSHRWSTNAMDVIGFGHIDAYVNAWAYRAFHNLRALFARIGASDSAERAQTAAERIRHAFAAQLLNAETGWVAGWRSRDGILHDYAFLWVNGPAIAFGLLDDDQARTALSRLEQLRVEVGLGSAEAGFPTNLIPIAADDHMAHIFTPVGQPSFELYTDGGLSGSASYYLRALDIYGLADTARRLGVELLEGYRSRLFSGPMGGGQEFLTWEGFPAGYEGTLVVRFDSLSAIAVNAGMVAPFSPEWWPE